MVSSTTPPKRAGRDIEPNSILISANCKTGWPDSAYTDGVLRSENQTKMSALVRLPKTKQPKGQIENAIFSFQKPNGLLRKDGEMGAIRQRIKFKDACGQ